MSQIPSEHEVVDFRTKVLIVRSEDAGDMISYALETEGPTDVAVVLRDLEQASYR